MPMTEARSPRSFILFSPCGHGNLGDAAVQDAVLAHLRRRVPSARCYGVTLRPSDTEKRHGIPAYPIGGISFPTYRIDWPEESESAQRDQEAATPLSAGPASPLATPHDRLRGVVAWLAKRCLPSGWPGAIRMELKHLRGAYRLLKDVDVVIVSGGGQLDDFWGGPWGHPYALFKWGVLARLTGTKVMIVSTGFCVLEHWLSRVFTRAALRLSDYCSYRDPGSKALMQQAGFRRDDAVYPDLAFSLDVKGIANRRSADPSSVRQVCISPMVYCDPKTWPTKNPEIFARYLEKLTAVTCRLLEQGIRICLVASDGPDNRTVEQIRAGVVSQLAGKTYDLRVPSVLSVQDWLTQASESHLVIASRLHGVILSQVVGTPVIALSYDRKVRALMELMDQSQYCLDIDTFEPDDVCRTVQELEGGWQSAHDTIMKKNQEFRAQLDGQYDMIVSGQCPVMRYT